MIKNYETDKVLDSAIIEAQYTISTFGSILTDYLNHGLNDANHTVIKERDKSEFKKDFQTKGNELRESMEKISNCLSRKKHTEDHLAAYVFLDEMRCNEYFIYNSEVILICLKDYVEDVTDCVAHSGDSYFYSHPLIKGKVAFICEMLHDISYFLEELYIAKQILYNKFVSDGKIDQIERLFITTDRPKSFKRSRFHAEEVFRNSISNMDRYFCYDDISHVPAALFQIRQSIEIRIWEIFGISWITDENDKPVKITAEMLLDLKGLDVNVDLHLKLSNLKLIHKWTNVYVHAGISQKYWQIYYAAKYIRSFIFEVAVANDDYYENLKGLIDKTLHGYGVKNIKWRQMDCISKTQRKKLEEIERNIVEHLSKNNQKDIVQKTNCYGNI